MKTSFLKITAMSMVATMMVAASAAVRAAESTNAPTVSSEAAAKHKRMEHAPLPFHGKLAAIDTKAMTIKVGERTFEITSETKIAKDNVPATLADGVVGEMVGGAFKKSADGKLIATTIRFDVAAVRKHAENAKPKAKKPGAETTEVQTNSVPK